MALIDTNSVRDGCI